MSTVKGNVHSDIHWKNEWFSTDWPSFLVFSNEKKALVDWELSIYKGPLYFNEEENRSIYISAGYAELFAGYNEEKRKLGVFAEAYLFNVGYDGRYIDASVPLVGVGFVLAWDKKAMKFRIKIDPLGSPGIDISIDIGQILKDVFGLEW